MSATPSKGRPKGGNGHGMLTGLALLTCGVVLLQSPGQGPAKLESLAVLRLRGPFAPASAETASKPGWADDAGDNPWKREWQAPFPSDEDGDEALSSVASLQLFDRHAEPVHVMPEGNVIMGTLLMSEADLGAYRKMRPECAVRDLCAAPKRFRACSWCTGARCLHGSLRSNGGIVTGEPLRGKQLERSQQASLLFSGGHKAWSKRVRMYPLLFSCELDDSVPMGVPGMFNVTWPHKGRPMELLVSNQLVRRPTVVPAGSGAVCGRATFGEVNAGNIVQLSEYYRFHGFASVYMYQAGSTTLTQPLDLEMYLQRLAADNSTSLRMLDMREHLDRMYGGGSDYAFLFSFSGAQMWTKFDCQLRARRDGHAWTLHTDLDEYVFPGINLIKTQDPATPLFEHMRARVGPEELGFTLGGLNPGGCDQDIHLGISWPLAKAASSARWAAFMRRVSKHHTDVEHPRALDFFARQGHKVGPPCPSGGAGCDYHKVLGGPGTRKLFVRAALAPQLLRVHEVSHSVRKRVPNLDVDDLHHRHYRCINQLATPRRATIAPAT